MESNWRWNIWLYAMWGSDWELCARVNTGFPTIYLLLVSKGDGVAYYYYTNGPGQVPVLNTAVVPPPGPFPWGVPVFPD